MKEGVFLPKKIMSFRVCIQADDEEYTDTQEFSEAQVSFFFAVLFFWKNFLFVFSSTKQLLWRASEEGNIESIEKALKDGADINLGRGRPKSIFFWFLIFLI